jgi:hypothetical protein
LSGSEIVVTADAEVRHETVFRERWRDRRSAGARPGELIKQPRWIDAGLVVLAVLVAAGAVACATVTVARTVAFAAVAQGSSVTAIRSDGQAPAAGTVVQFRNASGMALDAVVVDVTATEVTAQLGRPGPASTGELLVPAGRQRLISVLLPRLR